MDRQVDVDGWVTGWMDRQVDGETMDGKTDVG